MEKVAIIIVGFLTGYLLRNQKKELDQLAHLVFFRLLPYVVIVEVSSTALTSEWYLFAWGSGFVLGLFYLGKMLGFDKHQSALLATAEGGTLGFVLYIFIGTEALSRFFLVDMLGNGGVLFSFVYFTLMREFKIKDFITHPLMLAMGTGVLLNLFGIRLVDITYHDLHFVTLAQPLVIKVLTFLICGVVGSQINLHVSKEIFFSREIWMFWLIRCVGAVGSVLLGLPLAFSVLFVLPPSFLLPVVYTEAHDADQREYCSNFIAATLPVSLLLCIALAWWIKI